MLTELGKTTVKFEYLATQLGIANTHLYFFRQLTAAEQGACKKEFYKSLDFWGYTISAHIQATVVHLCRVYDTHGRHAGGSTLHLLRFVQDIGQSKLTHVEHALHESDLKFLQKAKRETGATPHPAVAKLRAWRNSLVAHRDYDWSLTGIGEFLKQYPVDLEEIQFLIDRGFQILDHWKRYCGCEGEIKRLAGGKDGYKSVLDALRLFFLQRPGAEPAAERL